MTRALLEQARDALTHIETCIHGHDELRLETIYAIRAHLAKPQGEPSHQPLPRCIHCGRHPNDPKWDLTPVAPQAQPDKPLKERPDFIAGYMAGMADGKALRAQTERERAAKVCDDMKKAFVTAKFPTDYECSAAMNAAMKCATKIRELK